MWGPQEAQHGRILDELQVRIGRAPATADLATVSTKIRVLGALAHVAPVHDLVRMLYYLTGMSTARPALLAYHRLHDGLVSLAERAVADTIITPIRRQEPGHYAFYQMSARRHWQTLAGWQRWLVRRLRALSFSPVGANSIEQKADLGEMMLSLGIDSPSAAGEFAAQIARVERDLLFERQRGLAVPAYIARAFREAVELAQAPAKG